MHFNWANAHHRTFLSPESFGMLRTDFGTDLETPEWFLCISHCLGVRSNSSDVPLHPTLHPSTPPHPSLHLPTPAALRVRT